MKLYIDKENLISLIKSKDNYLFEDCQLLIRKELDVQYNFEKSEIEKNEYLLAWFQRFGDGIKGEQIFSSPERVYPARPVKSNFYINGEGETFNSIYLIDDEHICEVIAEKSCVLIGKIGDEVNILESLMIEKETRAISIESWKSFCPNLPLSDVIIADTYYFKNKEKYEKNNNELIGALANIPHNSPLNVVIITKPGNCDERINLEEEQKRIKELVKKKTGSAKSSVTILTSNKLHDRYLITNYYRINHGSCFHLNDYGLKEDVRTEIKSHAVRSNEKFSAELISIYQEIALSPVKCVGDKKSNLIRFE